MKGLVKLLLSLLILLPVALVSAAEPPMTPALAAMVSVQSPVTSGDLAGVIGIPKPIYLSCTATVNPCPNWPGVSVSCAGNTTCTSNSSSVTCDSTTTSCPAGSCDPPLLCVAHDEVELFCQCVSQGDNSPQRRLACAHSVC